MLVSELDNSLNSNKICINSLERFMIELQKNYEE